VRNFLDSEFYSIKEIAVVFNVHPNTIRTAIKKGFILAIRIGEGPKSPYRISKKHVQAIHHSILAKLALTNNPKKD